MIKPNGISNETLAAMLRAMCATGICATSKEQEYLREAADRLEDKDEDRENEMRGV